VKEFARLAERFLLVYVTPVAVALLSFCPDLCHETRVEWKVVAAAVEFVTAVLSSPARQGDEKNSNQKYSRPRQCNVVWSNGRTDDACSTLPLLKTALACGRILPGCHARQLPFRQGHQVSPRIGGRLRSFTVLARVARIGSTRTNWMAALFLLTSNGHSYATVARGYDPSPFPQATTTKLEAS